MKNTRNRVVELVRLPASSLVPHELNYRVHGKSQTAALKGILQEIGVADALLVRKLPDGRFGVIDGHLRKDVLKDEEVPCLVLDLNDLEAKKLLTVLDPIGAMAGSDADLLEALLKEVSFDDAALTKLIGSLARDAGVELNEALEDDEAVELPSDPVTVLGDLWVLGSHRLLCGDSTKTEDVTRLMNGERATLMATDPPYLVDYKGGNHPQSTVNDPDVKDKHWDDYKDPKTSVDFFFNFLKLALDVALIENPAVMQWHASRRQALVEEAWTRAGLFVHQQVVWVKTRAILTYSWMMWQHEPAFFGWVEGKQPSHRPAPNLTTVWQIDQKDAQSGIHPTEKPLEIFGIPIRGLTQTKDVVYEPFSGSGSQIVAAEKLGRRCYAMELAPAYVDAAVARWERVTGKKAINETRPGQEIG